MESLTEVVMSKSVLVSVQDLRNWKMMLIMSIYVAVLIHIPKQEH